MSAGMHFSSYRQSILLCAFLFAYPSAACDPAHTVDAVFCFVDQHDHIPFASFISFVIE
jgi:hypothetical protein